MINKLEDLEALDPTMFSSVFLNLFSQKKLTSSYLSKNYFLDHQISIFKKTKEKYKIHLTRDNNINYFVEDTANIADNLSWIIPKAHKKLLPFYFAFKDSSMICLNDSWSLLGWVNHLLNFQRNYKSLEEIVLIHYDSHLDYAPPMIGRNEDGFFLDFITGNSFNAKSFWDIFLSIGCGSIGIGSFISILPLLFNKVHILHIDQFNKAKISKRFCVNYIEDELIKKNYPTYKRLNLDFSQKVSKDNYFCFYHCSNSIDDLSDFIPKNTSVYLHVDMDFFNNRFDGSSQQFRKKYMDINSFDQIKTIKKVVASLNRFTNRITHTSIALSPGFFPSEYFEKITTNLIHELANAGLMNIFDDYQYWPSSFF